MGQGAPGRDPGLSVLADWEAAGAQWRVAALTPGSAVVTLCTCTGEAVDRVEFTDPAVVAHLRDVLGVPVIVLRLLRVDGGDGSRDGHVTYHAAALSRPARTSPEDPAGPGEPADLDELTRPEELRLPWARLDGVRELPPGVQGCLVGDVDLA